MAVAENADGHKWSCNTSSTTCQIPELLCGQEYKVYVIGIDLTCIGAMSEIEMIRTGEYLHYSMNLSSANIY